MAENTEIAWTDHTFNPWWGCTKVGPGCDHCYAETLDKRTGGAHWGVGAERRRTSESNWKQPLKWHRQAVATDRRFKVFCASMADVFDNAVPKQWRLDLAALIMATPNLDWILLTKRIGNADEMLREMFPDGVPVQVWVGATAVNQVEYDRDKEKLSNVPAMIKFWSIEPMLGPIEMGQIWASWVIVGGESGAGARPMHPDWVRNIRDECAKQNKPFFFKQWGEWAPGENACHISGWRNDATWWNDQWVYDSTNMSDPECKWDDPAELYRIGKKAAGHLLDGTEHYAWPGE